MAILEFINAAWIDPYNFEVKIKIEDLKDINIPADLTQFNFDFPPNFVIEEVDWGDGSKELSMRHTYTPGEYTIKAKVSSVTKAGGIDRLDLSYNNIVEFVRVPGLIGDQSIEFKPTYIDLSNNKVLTGGFEAIIDGLMEKYPENVDRLNAMVNKTHYLNLNGQLGHVSKIEPTNKVPGLTRDPARSLSEEVMLKTVRTQSELDKGWELINKGWRVEMAIDDIYTIRMPKSVDDVFVDGHHGNDAHGLRIMTALPFFNAETNELSGRIMKVFPAIRQSSNQIRDERDSAVDGYPVHRSTVVPQHIYLTWEFQKPGETTWSQDFVVDPIPVPSGGDEYLKLPAKFEGMYKMTKPIVLDREKYPSGTKVRVRNHFKWGSTVAATENTVSPSVFRPNGVIATRLRTVPGNGLEDNHSLILTLP